MSQGHQLNNILKPEEVNVIQLALDAMIEDVSETLKSVKWNTGARKDLHEILDTAKSAQNKLGVLTGSVLKLAPYVEGDDKKFIEH